MNPDPLLASHTFSQFVAQSPKTFFLIGVNGIGMAGLARLLLAQGHTLHGSDCAPGHLAELLQQDGLIMHSDDAAPLLPPSIDAIIRSKAVPDHNPCILQARTRNLPVWLRGEALAALVNARHGIAISGTHGKTTTTAMLAHILREAGVPCGVCIGGESPHFPRVGDPGTHPFLIVEADESDGTLAAYRPALGIVTNIEFDHMEHFSDPSDMIACFTTFLKSCTQRVLCADDPELTRLRHNLPAIGYGFSEHADVRGIHVICEPMTSSCEVFIAGHPAGHLFLPVPGRHNLLNALGAFTAACQLGVQNTNALEALATYRPVSRRFEIINNTPGREIISDYAHHPAEIRAVLDTVILRHPSRIVAVFQPHRYSRTHRLMDDFASCFNGIDHLVLAPVYPASEAPIPGGDSETLAQRIQAHTTRPSCETASSLDDALSRLEAARTSQTLTLVLGAGDVVRLAHKLTP